MKQYVALARVSSREQEREGFSLEVQQDALKKYADTHGGKIVKLSDAEQADAPAGLPPYVTQVLRRPDDRAPVMLVRPPTQSGRSKRASQPSAEARSSRRLPA